MPVDPSQWERWTSEDVGGAWREIDSAGTAARAGFPVSAEYFARLDALYKACEQYQEQDRTRKAEIRQIIDGITSDLWSK